MTLADPSIDALPLEDAGEVLTWLTDQIAELQRQADARYSAADCGSRA